MNRRAELRLALRERRAAFEQALLNRSFRANKSAVDRAITAVVATQVPKVEPEPGRTKVVDSHPRERPPAGVDHDV